MQLWIDGDGCPVVRQAVEIARSFGLEVWIFCDTAHHIQVSGARTVVVSKGADNVDFALVNRVQPGDVVVTQDYGLAAMCLARGALPLRQDGLWYTQENIQALLQTRHMAQRVRRGGGRLKGPKRRTAQEDEAFVRALEEKLRQLQGP